MANKLAVIINGKEFVSKEAIKAETSIKSLGTTSSNVNNILQKAFLATAAGVVAATTAMVAGAMSAAKQADRIDKLSQKIGVTTEAFQEWDYVMSQNGMSIESLKTSVKTLIGAADDAANGNEKYASSFRKLGISVLDGNKKLKSQDVILEETILALSKMGKTSERTAIASDLLGRSATELAPLFNSGAQSIEQLRQKARDLGLILSKDTISAGVKLTDMMDTLKRSMQATLANAMTPVMEELTDIGGKFLAMSTGDGPIAKFAGILVRTVAWAVDKIPYIAGALGFVYDAILITYDELEKIFTNVKKSVAETFKDLGFDAITMPIIDVVMRVTGAVYEGVKKGLNTGDWGDFWTASGISLKYGFSLVAGFKMAEMAGANLLLLLKTAFQGMGLLTAGKGIGVGEVLAGMSIAVALIEAGGSGEWEKFGANMVAALAIGMGIGAFTKSPQAGVLAFTLAMNLELGSTWTDKIKEEWKPMLGTVNSFWEKIPEEMQSNPLVMWASGIVGDLNYIFGLGGKEVGVNFAKEMQLGVKMEQERQEIGKIISEFDLLWTKYGMSTPNRNRLIKVWGLDTGRQILEGMGISLEGINKLGENSALILLEGLRDKLDIDSPSGKGEEIGEFFLAGLANGLDSDTYWNKLKTAWKDRMGQLGDLSTIDVSTELGGITGGDSGGGDSGGGDSGGGDSGGGDSSAISTILDMFKGIGPLVQSLGSVTALLDPFGTILGGIMEVLGPVIDEVLAPLVGILKVVGHMFGAILAPAIRTLTPIIELVSQGFLWMYNNVFIHIGNLLIKIFNGISITFAHLMNGLSWIIKTITFGLVDLGRVAVPSENRGMLSPIDMATLISAGSNGSSFTGGGTGSSTSVQSVNITIHQHFDGNVIGEGGLEQVGAFMVDAIRAYAGVGGSVQVLIA
jgi:uncharacterized membrane protein YgcG